MSFALRILFVYVAVTGIFELITGIMFAYGVNNMVLFHTYFYIEFLAISAIFFFSYDSVFWRGIVGVFLVSFLAFSLIDYFYFDAWDPFKANERYAEGLMVIIMCAGYYISLLRRPIHRYLERQPMFWLTSGWLIYFAGTLYLFLFSKELLEMDSFHFWQIHAILNIGLNVIYVVSFVMGRRL
ncbi:MAG: hypothetical protein NXI10_04835 [bacterium]|nr:hypothetical protein [bacterium]